MGWAKAAAALFFSAACGFLGEFAVTAGDDVVGSAESVRSSHETVCSSLSGPFCLHLGADASFAPYMTPIEEPRDGDKAKAETHKFKEIVMDPKKCFFRHFSRSWMDAGGEANDLMSQRVKAIDECEQLCCEHPKCKSYTFWMGHTCFLRATRNIPREDGNSFSGNKLQ